MYINVLQKGHLSS